MFCLVHVWLNCYSKCFKCRIEKCIIHSLTKPRGQIARATKKLVLATNFRVTKKKKKSCTHILFLILHFPLFLLPICHIFIVMHTLYFYLFFIIEKLTYSLQNDADNPEHWEKKKLYVFWGSLYCILQLTY